MQVFGKVKQRRTDLAMDRMDRAVGGMAQRNDQNLEPEALQSQDLLSDESFRKPRIPFEDKSDPSRSRRRCRHTQVPSGSVSRACRKATGPPLVEPPPGHTVHLRHAVEQAGNMNGGRRRLLRETANGSGHHTRIAPLMLG